MASNAPGADRLRRYVTVAKGDQSALDWWDAQSNPGASLRVLIRSQVEQSGYVDALFEMIRQTSHPK